MKDEGKRASRKGETIVRWTETEWGGIARQMTRLIKGGKPKPGMLVARIIDAQEQILPRERWRPWSSIKRTINADAAGVVARLQAAAAIEPGANDKSAPRVRWNDGECALVARALADLMTGDAPSRVVLTERALQAQEAVLPRARWRTLVSLYGSTVPAGDGEQYKTLMDRLREAWAALPEEAQEAQEDAAPAALVLADPVSESAADGAGIVRWKAIEIARIAHAIAPHLRKDHTPGVPALVEAIVQAQARVLPRDRWRRRDSIAQGFYTKGGTRPETLLDRLREGLRNQAGLHVPIDIGLPKPGAAIVADSAPSPSPSPVDAGPAPAAPAVEDRADALAQAIRGVIMEAAEKSALRAAQEVAAGLESRMLQTLVDLVRRTVVEVVGGEPAPPDGVNGHDAPAAALVPAPDRVERIRVDVVGLERSNVTQVKNAIDGARFNVRFMTADEIKRAKKTAPIVVVCAKFAGHTTTDKASKSGARVLWANGGAASVIEQIHTLDTASALMH